MTERSDPEHGNKAYFLISPDKDWCDEVADSWAEAFLPPIRAALKQKGMLMEELDYFIGDAPVDWVLSKGAPLEDSKERLEVTVGGQHVCTLHVYQRERESQPTRD